MSEKPRPAKDAVFFDAISDSDWMLVSVAMTVATRKNFGSLNGLVDFLMVSGGDVKSLMENTRYSTYVNMIPHDPASPMTKRTDSTLTMAFATALCMHDVEGKMSREASPPEAIALAKRLGQLYNAPFVKTHALLRHLDQLLHDCASRVADPRILQILVDAGGSPDQMLLNAGREKLFKTLPMVEAVHLKNWEAASRLTALMSPERVQGFVDVLIATKGQNGSTSAQAFRKHFSVRQMVEGFREHPSQLDDYLQTLDAKVLSTESSDALKTVGRFRLQLAASFLESIAKTCGANPTPTEMVTLLGEPGSAIHAAVKGVLDAFACKPADGATGTQTVPNRWKFDSPKNKPRMYEEVEADFIYQALRTHCAPGLTFSQEVMVTAAREKGPGPEQAIHGMLMNTRSAHNKNDPFVLSPNSFRQTLTILQEAGWDLNALPTGNNALHVLAEADGEHMLKMLPILLDFGVEDDADDLHNDTPVGKINGPNEDQKVQQWDFIAKTHAARHNALSLIDEIEMEKKQANAPLP